MLLLISWSTNKISNFKPGTNIIILPKFKFENYLINSVLEKKYVETIYIINEFQ